MSEVVRLPGIRVEPIASYLSGIGLLRILNLQTQGDTEGFWQGDEFCMRGDWNRDSIADFLMKQYAPTPIMNPWSGGSGFYPKDNKTYVNAIAESTDARFEVYRQAIEEARRLLEEQNTGSGSSGADAKRQLLLDYRAKLPDAMLEWADAVFSLGQRSVSYMPLLGSGGNDGRLDFGINFMSNIYLVLLDPKKVNQSRIWLEDALFGTSSAPLINSSIGQFHPGGVGGPNAQAGFEGSSLVNPWTYVLMMEGAIAWAGSVSRRMGSGNRGRAAFPFTVTPVSAGWSTLADSDATSSRAEMWLPVWSRPTTYAELSNLLSEGRAVVGRAQARTSVDFAVAAAQLGVNRGVDGFARYSFAQRSGLAYLAAPAGRIEVRDRPHATLMDEVLPWADRLRRYAATGGAGAMLASAVRRLDDAIMQFASCGEPRRLAEVARSLGRVERILARKASSKFDAVPPLQNLSGKWLNAADDGTAELRLAAGVASIRDLELGSIRLQLEPVKAAEKQKHLIWTDRTASSVDFTSDAAVLFAELFRRRIIASFRVGCNPPVAAYPVECRLVDIDAFVNGQLDDERLIDLLYAFAAIDWLRSHRNERPVFPDVKAPDRISRAYAITKLAFLYGRPKKQSERLEDDCRVSPWDLETLNNLIGGNMKRALVAASRRLVASSRAPIVTPVTLDRMGGEFDNTQIRPMTIAGALLFPISDVSAKEELGSLVLHDQQPIANGGV